ncbi:N-6 DNA methylase [Butyrivibrio fibrisolvens]|uniref:N-6 DNA methylase n=1 Tax=Butyrivibrio fibrisolvens TaxID=831 RepID=UPI000423B891|nr:N-6 DNA methylase [Butyrivibrio fibrisolvens]
MTSNNNVIPEPAPGTKRILEEEMKEYQIGSLMANYIRNCIAHSAVHVSDFVAAITLAVFAIFMRAMDENREFSLLPDELTFESLKNASIGEFPYDALRAYLDDLEQRTHFTGDGLDINLYKELEKNGLTSERDYLRTVFEWVSTITLYGEGDKVSVFVACAVGLLNRFAIAGAGLSSMTALPIPLMQLIKSISDLKGGESCYGATGESTVLLPYIMSDCDGTMCISQVNDHYLAVKKMIQFMSANNTDIINTVSITPCIPQEKYKILNNFDKAYTFAPVFKVMLPNADLFPHSQETANNIRWWPDIKNDGHWLFTRHALASLNDNGMCYSLIPLNLLLRLGEAEETRKAILDENLLDAVIELPRELFSGGHSTPISTGGYTRYAIVVLKKGRTNKDVFMLNLASKASKDFLTSEPKYEYCDFNDIDEVADIFKNRKSMDGISSKVSVETIFESGLCFNPSAFIRDEVLGNTRDYKELLSEQKQLEMEFKEIDLAYKDAMKNFVECL